MKKAQIIRLMILIMILAIGGFLLGNEFSSFYQKGIVFLIAILAGLWLISLWIKDASIIDIFWGTGFVFVAWFYFYEMDGITDFSTRSKVLLTMITLWGMRLTLYLGFRNIGKGEDFRYAKWRKDNGKKWWWLSFVRVFLLQGFLIWIISAVFVPNFRVSSEMGIFEYIGIAFWAIGLFFETVGDYQLMRFKKGKNNQGKVMDKGLWKYTRHPNYFGDAMVWWGFFIFGLAHPSGLIYIFCPIIMTLFLVKVSGVAMLETTLKKTKPKYAEYIRKTSSFIPMPPKN